jgi:hypothetical protein
MTFPLLAVPVVLHLVAAASNSVPTLNVLPSCRAAANADIASADRMRTCVESEQHARDQLAKEWSSFNGSDRTACTSSVKNFEPSYTELMTCLEIADDARKLPAQLY